MSDESPSVRQLLADQIYATEEQIRLNAKVVDSHLDRLDRVHLRDSSQAIIDMAKAFSQNPQS